MHRAEMARRRDMEMHDGDWDRPGPGPGPGRHAHSPPRRAMSARDLAEDRARRDADRAVRDAAERRARGEREERRRGDDSDGPSYRKRDRDRDREYSPHHELPHVRQGEFERRSRGYERDDLRLERHEPRSAPALLSRHSDRNGG